MNIKELSNQLKEKGFNINEANLETARMLLVEMECESEASNPMAVVRVALLREQNPTWSDDKLVREVLKASNTPNKQGYGEAIAVNLHDTIVNSIIDSGMVEDVTNNVKITLTDMVIGGLATSFDSQRFDNRKNALTSSSERYRTYTSDADENILDVSYTETLDDVIASLPATENKRLLTTGDIFRAKNDGEIEQKKLLGNNRKTGEKN